MIKDDLLFRKKLIWEHELTYKYNYKNYGIIQRKIMKYYRNKAQI